MKAVTRMAVTVTRMAVIATQLMGSEPDTLAVPKKLGLVRHP